MYATCHYKIGINKMGYTKTETEWFDSIAIPEIINAYQKYHTVTDVLNNIKHLSFGRIKTISRAKITETLKREGVYAPYSEDALRVRHEKSKSTMLDRYGVINPGQLPDAGGYQEYNRIPYNKLEINKKVEDYKQKVNKITKLKHRCNRRANKLPEFCYYTGIKFSDANTPKVNPNDPLKRSIDHKTSVIYCYLNGWTPEKCASKDNMVYVLRYVNTIKSNTLEKDFIPIAAKLRKELIHEGFEHN